MAIWNHRLLRKEVQRKFVGDQSTRSDVVLVGQKCKDTKKWSSCTTTWWCAKRRQREISKTDHRGGEGELPSRKTVKTRSGPAPTASQMQHIDKVVNVQSARELVLMFPPLSLKVSMDLTEELWEENATILATCGTLWVLAQTGSTLLFLMPKLLPARDLSCSCQR